MKIYMNGKLVAERDAKVSVFDHGLLYGDGVFEGIRSYNGRVFMLDEHVERLYSSAKAIDLTIPMTPKGMSQAVVRTCVANKTRDGYIRLVVTRGVGTLGLNPYLCKKAQVIIISAAIQLYPKKVYEEGLRLVTVGTVRNMSEAVNPRIKSLNYLNNILAKIEAINNGCMEAIMLNARGEVAEATGDNIFVIKGRSLITPPVQSGILEGITRNVVMQLAVKEGLDVREQTMSRYDVYTADEVFLTGTAAEVIGVVDVDKRKIGNGRPGPVTQLLEKRFKAFAASTGRRSCSRPRERRRFTGREPGRRLENVKCELCQKNDASVHFKQVVDGDVRELYVCPQCASENGFDVQSPMAMTDFLFGLGIPETQPDGTLEKTCPACGLTLGGFRKSTRLGCARCYETFAEEIEPLLHGMHRADRHVGKVPAGERLTGEIVAMQKALEKAISCEDFEEAAVLRDKLRELKFAQARAVSREKTA
jgi:branched-chain amino acid aminotransferase